MSEVETTGGSGASPSEPRSGFWRRFAAAFLDGLLLNIAAGIVGAILDFDEAGRSGLSLLFGIVYFTYLEGSTGQTLGKSLLGIRVVSLRGGGSIGFGRALIRYLGRYVSALALLIGYLWMIWDREKQTWHDKFAGSVVIKVRD